MTNAESDSLVRASPHRHGVARDRHDASRDIAYHEVAPESSVHQRLLRHRYAHWAPRYDRAFRAYSDATITEALRILDLPPPSRLLDVACGTGLLIERFRRAVPASTCVGVDLSDAMLACADDRLGGDRAVELLTGPAEALPVSSRSVDAVTIVNAFHLLDDQEAALAECRRVLVPGGRLAIVDWCRDDFGMRLLAVGLAVTQRLRRRVLSVDRLASLLASSGFTMEAARRFRANPAWGLMAVRARSPLEQMPRS